MAISSSVEEEYDPEVGEDIQSDEPEVLEPQEPNAGDVLEARAREMGWHPLAEYRGSPGKWVDAATFVQRGETILPIMRDNNRRLQDQLSKQGDEITGLRRTIEEQKEVLTEMRDLAKRSNEQGYQRARRELMEQRDAAVVAGDTVTFKQVDEQIDELDTARAETTRIAPPKPPPTPETPQMAPEIQAFVDANPWWNKDAVLSNLMIAEHTKVMARSPGASLAQQLDTALNNLKREFPEKFGLTEEEIEVPNPPPRPRLRAASVSQPTPGGSGQPRRQENGISTISDPEERRVARGAYDRMKRQMPDFTEAEYMKIYNDPHADVVEMSRSRSNGRA